MPPPAAPAPVRGYRAAAGGDVTCSCIGAPPKQPPRVLCWPALHFRSKQARLLPATQVCARARGSAAQHGWGLPRSAVDVLPGRGAGPGAQEHAGPQLLGLFCAQGTLEGDGRHCTSPLQNTRTEARACKQAWVRVHTHAHSHSRICANVCTSVCTCTHKCTCASHPATATPLPWTAPPAR